MPDFLIELNKDGTIRQTYKDGMPIPGAKLEMRESIVQTYFKACEKNLLEMKKITDDSDLRRLFGLQSFLMSLLGVEAFLNVFFHAVAREKDLGDALNILQKPRLTVEEIVSRLPRLVCGSPISSQKRLNQKLRELYNLRSEIVHAKWEPSSLSMPGFQLQDMVENRQQIFEDFDFCIETLRWALLVIARVGEHVAGKNDWFVWRWTTIQTNNEQLSDLLGIPADGR